jgi:hypothetical protein
MFGIAVPAYFATNLLHTRFHILPQSGGDRVQGLSVIQYVTSGLTLIAFVAALAFNAYRLQLKNASKNLSEIPKDQRVQALATQAEMLHIDTQRGQLSGAALERFVLEQLRLKELRNRTFAWVAVVMTLLLAIVAIFAIVEARPSQTAGTDRNGTSNDPHVINNVVSADSDCAKPIEDRPFKCRAKE